LKTVWPYLQAGHLKPIPTDTLTEQPRRADLSDSPIFLRIKAKTKITNFIGDYKNAK